MVAGLVAYKAYSLIQTPEKATEIGELHGKIIQMADSSKGKSSTTGSTSSKSSKTNEKPSAKSAPVGKDVIRTGSGKASGDGEDEDEKDGDEIKKNLNKGAHDTSTNEGDSDPTSEEDGEIEIGRNPRASNMWTEPEKPPFTLIGEKPPKNGN